MDPSQTQALVGLAARAATEAGQYLASRFRDAARLRDGIVIRAKTASHRHDVVTESDIAAEGMIRATLASGCPGSGVVGEEAGQTADPSGGICWYVDPIDGTHNFARGIALFCVSIGVSCDGTMVGGCVYDPVREELFTAANGRLTLNGQLVLNSEPVPDGSPASPPLVLTDIPSAGVAPDPAEHALFTEVLDIADVRRIGSSALAMAYVSCGRADVAVNADVYAWDIAAGEVLVTAAGGGLRMVPERPQVTRPGGFVAWRPGMATLGNQIGRALPGLRALRQPVT